MPQPPPCVGTYEPDNTICNGDPRGLRVEDRAPCAWRNRCAGLRQYCGDNDQTPSLVVASLSYPALVALCEGQVKDHAIVDGAVRGQPAEAEIPSPHDDAAKGQPARAGAKANGHTRDRKSDKRMVPPQVRNARALATKPAIPLSDSAKDLHRHFEQVLRDFFPDRRFGSGRRVLVKPGTIYPIDRSARSQYVSWYCTVSKGRDLALACLRAKPTHGLVDVQLTVTLEELRKFLGVRTFKKLGARTFSDGQFLVLCPNLDREGLALCAETIRKLVEVDIIVLPE